MMSRSFSQSFHLALLELSGVAADGREPAGRLLRASPGWVRLSDRPCRLSCTACTTIPLDARSHLQTVAAVGLEGWVGRGDLAGAAHLELVSAVVQLRPEDAMFEAMLRGWRAQQTARGLRVPVAVGPWPCE
jgi:hypothetical protein